MGIRKRVLTLLHQRSATLAEVRDVLKELYRNIGDEGERGSEVATSGMWSPPPVKGPGGGFCSLKGSSTADHCYAQCLV